MSGNHFTKWCKKRENIDRNRRLNARAFERQRLRAKHAGRVPPVRSRWNRFINFLSNLFPDA